MLSDAARPHGDEPAGIAHRAGVLGDPIAHSLSPVLHRAAYRALGLLDWWYDATRVDADELPEHLASLDRSWRGVSLTMPLKEVAVRLADSVSPTVAATGAANTLVRTGSGWTADNTDVAGLRAALAQAGLTRIEHGVVVGSGATARSAVAALVELGADRVTFAVRDDARPETLAQALTAGLLVDVVPIGRWPADADVVVTTVPRTALVDLVDRLPEAARPGAAVLDVVYGDGPGPVSVAAARRGYAVVPGTSMLLHQAAEQVRLMTGLAAPLDAMRAALDDELAARSHR